MRLNPLSEGAATTRVWPSFDPEPTALLLLDFVGSKMAGRPLYKRFSDRYADVTQIPGWNYSGSMSNGAPRYAETRAGVQVPFATNKPRITDRGLLVEEARTQHARNNRFEDWTGAAPAGYSSPIAGRISKVPGVLGANALRISGSFFNDGNRVATPAMPQLAANTTYTMTIRCRRTRGASATIALAVDSWGSTPFLFDLGSVPLNQWVTQSMTATTGATVSSGGGFHTKGADCDIEIDWWQLEAGPNRTSFMQNDTQGVITRSADVPYVDGLGALLGQFRTNKVRIFNANPTGLADTDTTDPSLAVTLVDDSSALAAAGLAGLATSGKVFRLVNSGGAQQYFRLITSATGNTTTHVGSWYLRGGSGDVRSSGGFGSQAFPASTGYVRRTTTAFTPSSAASILAVGVDPGQTVYAILPQLEEGSTATDVIVTQGAPVAVGNPVTIAAWADMSVAADGIDRYLADARNSADLTKFLTLSRYSDNVAYVASSTSGGPGQVAIPLGNKAGSRVLKMAARVRALQALAASVDGSAPASSAIAFAPGGLDRIYIGTGSPGQGRPLNDYIQSIVVAADVNEATLQALTA